MRTAFVCSRQMCRERIKWSGRERSAMQSVQLCRIFGSRYQRPIFWTSQSSVVAMYKVFRRYYRDVMHALPILMKHENFLDSARFFSNFEKQLAIEWSSTKWLRFPNLIPCNEWAFGCSIDLSWGVTNAPKERSISHLNWLCCQPPPSVLFCDWLFQSRKS